VFNNIFYFYNPFDWILIVTFSLYIIATQIWEKGEDKLNSMDFAEAIDNSDLDELGFTDDFIIELWGVITDARAGRLKN